MRASSFQCVLIGFLLSVSLPSRADELDFARDVRPILAEKCYACHGPDESTREAGLRFDLRAATVEPLVSGARAIVPGEPDRSELIARIFHSDVEQRMPPENAKKQLTDQERELLRGWVAQGAPYATHWAFVAPKRPTPPPIEKAAFQQLDWPRNAIDNFVSRQQAAHGLSPSPEADKVTLIRRLSLDLRGLPPTVAEVDAFLNDTGEDAYERLVDAMLKSVHFGEKLAQDWLDLARYGDTNGYHNDSHREMWLYRDWIIHALYSNMPYDQFVREQLAGDLMSNATPDQRIASAFNRNAPFNEEGGADPDEFYVAYAVDRTNTTGQGLLGLTIGCAQCHSHKYDPISQTEYYEFLAFFNSVDGEIGGGGENGHHNKPVPPTFAAKSPLRRFRASQLEIAIDRVQGEYASALQMAIDKAHNANGLQEWLRKHQDKGQTATKLPVTKGLVLHLDATDINGNGAPDAEEGWTPPAAIDIWTNIADQQPATANAQPKYLPDGFGGRPAIRFDGEATFVRTPRGGQRLAEDFTIVSTQRLWRDKGHQMLVMWGEEARGKRRSLWITNQKLQFSFNGYHADVIGQKALHLNKPSICTITKSGDDHQVRFNLNGEPAGQGKAELVSFAGESITVGANNAGRENASVDFAEVLVYDRALTSEELTTVGEYLASKFSITSNFDAVPRPVAEILSRPVDSWTSEQRERVVRHYVESVQASSSARLQTLRTELDRLAQQRDEVLAGQSTVMVMKAMPKRKPTFVLNRGDFQQPGEQVQPDVPDLFPKLPEGPRNRLTLANWITHPTNPLLSRVRVNHLWKICFGHGLVRTPGDFGTQGAPPTHPELLDWLAVEFVESGWDTKHLIKQMVMSATYRQQSRVDRQALAKDPDNRWLARAPRFRLTAEEIRDAALAASGLLNRTVGGPSVRPFQPTSYFSANNGKRWEPSRGDDALRRGLYTYWQRTAPYAAFLIFDAPSRQICTARRARTNTPLQALVTLNDPEFHQASRALAVQIIDDENASDDEKLLAIWRRVLSRLPNEQEMDILRDLLKDQLEHYRHAPHAAAELGKHVADDLSPRNATLLAAWTNVAAAIMNLDEAITRE